MRTTPSTSIPDAAASEGLSETARVALPMRVRSSQKARARIATRLTPIETMSMTLIVTEPNRGIFCASALGSWEVPPPMKNWNR